MKTKKEQIRYAVVGLGHIAQVAVLPAFKHARKNSLLTALVTGNPRKAKLVAQKYKVDKVVGYEEYDALLASGDIDAVYIAIPNDQHLDYGRRALAAGIHVLCEKPLAVSTAECQELIRASQSSGARLMTAYRLHFDKPNLDAVELCRKKKLGRLKSFVSFFSYVIKDNKNIRVQPGPGAGPLWDIGIYCINAVRYLFGENPVEVFAYSTRQQSGPFAEVDESVTAVLRFPEDRTATFTCSFNAATSAYFEVYGDMGMLRLNNAYEYTLPPELITVIKEKRTRRTYQRVDQFAPELHYFSDCILKKKKIEPSGEEGLTDIAVIQAIEASLQSGRAVKVTYGRNTQEAHPQTSMAMRKPAVKKPDLVLVKSAAGD